MTRSDIVLFSDLCRAAADSYTMASCGVTPARRMALQINAESALNAALDMVWQTKSGLFDDAVKALSAQVIAFASAANADADPDPTPPAASMAVPLMMDAAA